MAESSERTFEIEVSGNWNLTVGEIWPDGDAPERPTAQDVIAEVEKTGRISALVQGWNLEPDTVLVDGRRVNLQ